MNENQLDEILAVWDKFHLRNKKRIKFGLKCMYIIPAIFLVLMFVSSAAGSSKVTFLVLWIASMFIISAVLIVVEYLDHTLFEKMEKALGTELEYDGITGSKELEIRNENWRRFNRERTKILKSEELEERISKLRKLYGFRETILNAENSEEAEKLIYTLFDGAEVKTQESMSDGGNSDE